MPAPFFHTPSDTNTEGLEEAPPHIRRHLVVVQETPRRVDLDEGLALVLGQRLLQLLEQVVLGNAAEGRLAVAAHCASALPDPAAPVGAQDHDHGVDLAAVGHVALLPQRLELGRRSLLLHHPTLIQEGDISVVWAFFEGTGIQSARTGPGRIADGTPRDGRRGRSTHMCQTVGIPRIRPRPRTHAPLVKVFTNTAYGNAGKPHGKENHRHWVGGSRNVRRLRRQGGIP